jgi:hypothetical protein
MCDSGASLLCVKTSLHRPATPYKRKHKEDHSCVLLLDSTVQYLICTDVRNMFCKIIILSWGFQHLEEGAPVHIICKRENLTKGSKYCIYKIHEQ